MSPGKARGHEVFFTSLYNTSGQCHNYAASDGIFLDKFCERRKFRRKQGIRREHKDSEVI